jgi:enolase-phosphatase E1
MVPVLTNANARAVLLDIEGTTTPIAFVHDVLFSYARSHVKHYLAAHFGAAEILDDLARLREEHSDDLQRGLEPPALERGSRDDEVSSMAAYVCWLIGRDRKSAGLKSLQGKIWREGYLEGTLKAQVFEDVAPALRRWHGAGLKIGIFSSGSVLAQKLLFAHTEAGDLTEFIAHYFDTSSGAKTEAASYRRIASALGLRTGEVLFISDVVAELDAAVAAGMRALLCVRPGNQPQPSDEGRQLIRSFDEIPDPRAKDS